MPDPGEAFSRRCQEAAALARYRGASSLVASDGSTVRWLSGREAEIGWGPLYPFAAGTFVVLRSDGTGWIVCAEGDEEAGPPVPGLELETYVGYTVEPLRPYENCRALLLRLLARAARGAATAQGPGRTRQPAAPEQLVAIEAHAHPVALAPEGDTVDLGESLRTLRLRKDTAEIGLIECAARVVSAGQRAFRELAEPGLREIDLFSLVHTKMEEVAGSRVPVLPDLISGPRMLSSGVPPSDRVIEADELVLCDLLARVDGYWADSCTTICVGAPTLAMRQLNDACREALEVGISMARPGTESGDLDSRLRSIVRRTGFEYPHHSGHGVGTSFHEEPRIVPGATGRLEEGMVIAIEPAGFGQGIGCRVEHLVEVMPGGGRLLTDYDLQL
jgi:Xaa-Pro aminopeptidase